VKTNYKIKVDGPIPEDLKQRLEAGELSPEDFFGELSDRGIPFYPTTCTLEAEPGDGIKISKAHLDYEGL